MNFRHLPTLGSLFGSVLLLTIAYSNCAPQSINATNDSSNTSSNANPYISPIASPLTDSEKIENAIAASGLLIGDSSSYAQGKKRWQRVFHAIDPVNQVYISNSILEASCTDDVTMGASCENVGSTCSRIVTNPDLGYSPHGPTLVNILRCTDNLSIETPLVWNRVYKWSPTNVVVGLVLPSCHAGTQAGASCSAFGDICTNNFDNGTYNIMMCAPGL